MSTQTPANDQVQTPSLPKGGGAIHSLGNSWGAVGMTGAASLQIPLPLSAGRVVRPATRITRCFAMWAGTTSRAACARTLMLPSVTLPRQYAPTGFRLRWVKHLPPWKWSARPRLS